MSIIVRSCIHAIAVGLAATAVAQCTYRVSGHSMAPTVHSGQFVIVVPYWLLSRAPAREDIVLVKGAWGTATPLLKRITGTSGDCIGPDGLRAPKSSGPCARVPTARYFLRGDSPNASTDSRVLGTVRREQIVGVMVMRIFGQVAIAQNVSRRQM